MRARYSKYFMNHVLQLQDELATYYVQECLSENDEVPGIEFKALFDHRAAVDWIQSCVSYDHCGIQHLRCFLNDSAPRTYLLYQMDDHEVMDEAARIIRDYDYPVVVRPMFEPPERQSDLIDLIFEVKNSAAPPVNNKAKPSQYYQVGELNKSTLDNNVPLNVLKIIPNGITEFMNQGAEAVNAIIYDAQYIADKGLGDYLKRLKKAGAKDIKHMTKGASDLVQNGPRHVINAITSIDNKILKEFFGSALYAENWEAAVQVALSMALFKKPKNVIPKGAGASTKAKAKVTKTKKPKRTAIDNGPTKKSKPKADDGPKKATVADRKFKKKHLDGDPKDPYTLMEDGKPMGAEVGKVPTNLQGLKKLPKNHDTYVKDGWPSLDVEYAPGRHTRDFRNFTDAKPDTLKPGTKIYRIIDDQSGEFSQGISGSYWTTEMPKNKTAWRKDYAVKDSWNDNGYVIEQTVGPEGLKVWRGGTAAQEYKKSDFFLKGGQEQIFVQRGAIGNPQPKLTNWPDL